MGAILFFIGITVMISGFGSGSATTGIVGLILTIVGAILFWQTSATKAYLDDQKRRR